MSSQFPQSCFLSFISYSRCRMKNKKKCFGRSIHVSLRVPRNPLNPYLSHGYPFQLSHSRGSSTHKFQKFLKLLGKSFPSNKSCSHCRKGERIICSIIEDREVVPVKDKVSEDRTTSLTPKGSYEIEDLTPSSSSKVKKTESGVDSNKLTSRTINAIIVLGFGTSAVTKLLTIDHDYWHGWSLYEIPRYAPEHNWIAYEQALKANPVLAKMACYEGKPLFEFDRTRLFRSGLVGLILHGSLSHYCYKLCEAGWKLWPFAHLITYGVVPLEQRLLWDDCVELIWVTILSTYSNEIAEDQNQSRHRQATI